MTRWLAISVIAAMACVQANDVRSPNPEAPVLCCDSWYRMIDGKVTTSDDQHHGPDVGSDEWKSVNSRYQGRHESFREHQGEALIRWGHDAPEMDCRKVP